MPEGDARDRRLRDLVPAGWPALLAVAAVDHIAGRYLCQLTSGIGIQFTQAEVVERAWAWVRLSGVTLLAPDGRAPTEALVTHGIEVRVTAIAWVTRLPEA